MIFWVRTIFDTNQIHRGQVQATFRMSDAIVSTPILQDVSPNFSRNVYCVLGLTLDALTFNETKQCVVSAMNERKRLFLTTPNTNFVTLSRSAPSFRDSIFCSDLCVADGMPLVWMSRILGAPIHGRVSGSSLFASLMEDATIRMKVFFLGGAEGIAKAASERLDQLGTSVCGAGYHFPGFPSSNGMNDPAVVKKINDAEADFLMVAVGAQRGQNWILENEGRLAVPVISYLGSTINFVAKSVERAPSTWQHLGFEWLWRIKEEPHLWRRYFVDLLMLLRLGACRVIPSVIYRLVNAPRKDALGAAAVRLVKDGTICTLSFNGSWNSSNLAPVRAALQQAADAKADIVLDFGELKYADAAFLGLILLAYGHQTRTGRRFAIRALGGKLRRILYLHACEFLAEFVVV
jgi:N-acetylglucosaminyldiphosphoundecaprenol N-acetyl-beta-D-mannosaminyltransferase